MAVDNQIAILTAIDLEHALAQIWDVIECDLDDDEVESLGETEIEGICYDVGVKPTPQIISAVLDRLDRL